MNKYLFKKLEQAHGAYIQNLVFIPSEVIRGKPTKAFKYFQELEEEQICETLDWRREEDVYEIIRNHIDESSFAAAIYQNQQTGFLAECHFPECSNFKFSEGRPEPITWSVQYGCCRIEWLYAESIGELVEKIVDKSDKIFEESLQAFKKAEL